jgi:ABC-type multidrug transport system fused ATPase/permease subunit
MAVVGPSGAGKSTLTLLLERFYEPTSGAIYLDGCNIAELDRREYRRHLGLVMQEPQLFSCSIRDNISYGGEVFL